MHRYRFVICDESHSLKDRTTRRYERVGPRVRGAVRAVLCTGTPIMNRPIEIWPQVGGRIAKHLLRCFRQTRTHAACARQQLDCSAGQLPHGGVVHPPVPRLLYPWDH